MKSNKKRIVRKGYTVEVVSWENDGDNYRTKSKTYKTKEEAVAVKHMCDHLLRSKNDNTYEGIGNLMDDDYNLYCYKVTEYLSNNMTLLSLNNLPLPETFKDSILEEWPELKNSAVKGRWKDAVLDYLEMVDTDTRNDWVDGISHYFSDLLGSSEIYLSRVAERTVIFYSEKDIYLDIIT